MVSSSVGVSERREPVICDTVLYPRGMEIPNKVVHAVVCRCNIYEAASCVTNSVCHSLPSELNCHLTN